jgi:5-methylcytosine-specific restriction protein A
MLKSCKYCLRVHDNKFDCGHKPKRTKESNDINRFRWSRRWLNKSKAIRERDHHLCQVCLLNEFDTFNQYNTKKLEVHHIIPLHENFDLRLDDENLITLCAKHHKMADKNIIHRDFLLEIVKAKY